MAKFTRKQIRQIESILYHAERAHKYLMDTRTAIARRDTVASTTLHYVRPDGSALYEVAKEIGSDLCGLPDAIRGLKDLVEDNGRLHAEEVE